MYQTVVEKNGVEIECTRLSDIGKGLSMLRELYACALAEHKGIIQKETRRQDLEKGMLIEDRLLLSNGDEVAVRLVEERPK